MKKGYAAITFFLIFVTVFCTTKTVMGMEKGNAGVDEKYYKQMEKEYVQQVRDFLQDEGYENSGVTLTKVLYEDGAREYTLHVHHKRLGNLSRTNLNVLRQMLEDLADLGEKEGICIEALQVIFS